MNTIKPQISPGEALLNQKVGQFKSKVKNKGKLEKASEDFEALFVYFMLRTMRKTVMKSKLLDTGMGGEIYQSLFDQEISRSIAHQTRLGIAELIEQQLAEQGVPRFEMPQFTPLNIRSIVPSAKPQPKGVERLKPFEPHIREASQRSGVDANLIRAVILAESSGRPEAVSEAGARGLMQLMDGTARQMGVTDPLDPRQNIMGGTAYLAQLLKRFDGDPELALAAYNAGPSAVERYGGVPPFPETRAYIQKVLGLYHTLLR